MLISVKKRFVFIANSKTGSTSIEQALVTHAEINRVGSPKRKHIGWSKVLNEYDFLFNKKKYSPDKFFRFGVIREPADWVLSWYNYRRFRKRKGIPKKMSFDEFWASDDWVKNKRQKDHFTDDDGSCHFDLIIPLKRLREALPILLHSLGVNDAQPMVANKSKGNLSKSDIPSALIDEINEYYREDWEFYQEWNERFDNVFPDVLHKFFPDSGVPKKRRTSSVSPAAVIVSKIDNESVIRANLKADFSDKSDVSLFDLRGVVLVEHGMLGNDAKLFISTPIGEKEIQWRLPSARLAKTLPDNDGSKNARFKIDKVRIDKGVIAEVLYDDGDGLRYPLFKLENIA